MTTIGEGLSFFRLDNGLVGFRGVLRGQRRCIVADSYDKLFAFIEGTG